MSIVIGFALNSHAQYYFNTYNPAGINPGGLNTDPEQPFGATGVTAANGYTSIIPNGTTTLTWSPVQTIPFPFSFNGTPVTQYKVSNSGVLTFTTSATTVPPFANATIPSASIPDNSVMVWGLQQMAGNDGVINKTHGTAPNRQHWINFASFSAPGASGSQWTYWGIVLEETTNNIYIVDLRTYLTPLTLTMGIQLNSTTAYQISGAPNTPSYVTNGGSVSDPSDNVYYEFIQGTRPNDDIKLETTNVPTYAGAGTGFTITGSIQNAGAATQSSVIINYSVNGGATQSHTVTGLSLASLASTNFSHSIPWVPSGPGNYSSVKVWTSLPAPKVDGNSTNDTLIYDVYIGTGNSVQRHAVLEEFTTAPCQFCPDGAYVVDQILASNPNVIGIGVHACFGTDAMTVPEASTICSTLGNNSAPMGMVDRVLFPGESSPAFSRANNMWATRANARAAQGAPVDITVTGSYTVGQNFATVTVSSSFVDYPLPGNINVSIAVVEDSVTGSGSGYNQVNYYNTISGHPYFGAGNPIVGFVHRHVLRDIQPSTWGDNTVIPGNNIALNTAYSKTFNVPLSTAWDLSKISLVAMVNYSGATSGDYEILQAEEVKLLNLITSIDKQTVSNTLDIFPNPTSQETYINFSLTSNEQVRLEVVDVTGKLMISENFGVMAKGKQQLIVNAAQLENGFYFVNLRVGDDLITRKISVLH